MGNIDITAILAQFVVAGIVYFFTDRERADDKEEIKELKEELKVVRQGWLDDLRDWSGIAPRFQTWASEPATKPRGKTGKIQVPEGLKEQYEQERESL